MMRPSQIRWALIVCSVVAATPAVSLAAAIFTPSVIGPPVPIAGDGFGRAVTSIGDRLIVGAPGFAYFAALPGRVFVMDARGNPILTIENPTPAPGDEFGAAVAAIGNDILVGAPFDNTAAAHAGAAYLFDGTTGALLQTFIVPGVGANYQCARRVAALAGNALVQCDGAYLFDVSTGAVLHHFTTPSGVQNDGFGTLGDDVILADGTNAYRLDGATGALVATYPNPDPAGGTYPGQIAEHQGNLLMGRGFPHDPEKVYLFDAATGGLLHTIVGDTFGTIYGERFGESVASAGDTIVVAAQLALYRFDGSTYERLDRFFPDDLHDAPAGEVATVFGTSYAARTYDPNPSRNDGRGRLYLFDRCGNGIATRGEQCDDGNLTDGDGCSSTCHLECPPTLSAAGCHSLTAGSTSTLKLQHKTVGAFITSGDKLQWKWKGAATLAAEFGDPTTTATYQLCIYDNLFGTQRLVMDPAVPAGAICKGVSCWQAKSADKLRLQDPERYPSGIEKIELRAGSDGHAQVSVTGRGIRLGLPAPTSKGGPLPLNFGIGVVLRNSATGACWSAGYANIKNKHGKLKAVGHGS
jgi:cysteine-rich repeat protein